MYLRALLPSRGYVDRNGSTGALTRTNAKSCPGKAEPCSHTGAAALEDSPRHWQGASYIRASPMHLGSLEGQQRLET